MDSHGNGSKKERERDEGEEETSRGDPPEEVVSERTFRSRIPDEDRWVGSQTYVLGFKRRVIVEYSFSLRDEDKREREINGNGVEGYSVEKEVWGDNGNLSGW